MNSQIFAATRITGVKKFLRANIAAVSQCTAHIWRSLRTNLPPSPPPASQQDTESQTHSVSGQTSSEDIPMDNLDRNHESLGAGVPTLQTPAASITHMSCISSSDIMEDTTNAIESTNSYSFIGAHTASRANDNIPGAVGQVDATPDSLNLPSRVHASCHRHLTRTRPEGLGYQEGYDSICGLFSKPRSAQQRPCSI